MASVASGQGGSPRRTRGGASSREFAQRTRWFRIVTVTASAFFVFLLAWGSLRTQFGQSLDTVAMYGFAAFVPFKSAASTLLRGVASVPALVVFALAIVATGLWRRRFALVLRVGILLVGANVTTQLLKVALSRPDLGVGHDLANSYPSGHVTLVTSVALALVAVAAGRWKRVAAVIAWLAVSLVSVAVMGLGWHRPSDVIAGILVAAAFAFLVLPSEWSPTASSPGTGFSVAAWLGLAVSVAGVAGVGWWARAVFADPLPAVSLEVLGYAASPGLILTVLFAVMVASLSGLAVLGVEGLAGGR